MGIERCYSSDDSMLVFAITEDFDVFMIVESWISKGDKFRYIHYFLDEKNMAEDCIKDLKKICTDAEEFNVEFKIEKISSSEARKLAPFHNQILTVIKDN